MTRVLAVILALVLAALGWQSWRLNEASRTIDQQGSDLKEKGDKLAKTNSQLIALSILSETNNREQARLYAAAESTNALLAGLEPAARKRMMRELAQQLRRSQQKNIRMQRNPDGTAYEPRRVTARTKTGRIRRQMFAKLRTAKYLKAVANPDSASVEFEGRVQRIARVHHYGLRDRVSRNGSVITYPHRRLLGTNPLVIELIQYNLYRWLFN